MSASTILPRPELNHDNSDIELGADLLNDASRSGSTSDIPDTTKDVFMSSDPSRSGSMTNIPGTDTPENVKVLTHDIPRSDIPVLLGIVVMLGWPWVFFGVLFVREGILLKGHFAEVVRNNPRTTNFFSTQIGTIINSIVAFLFSTAVLRFSQGWIARKEKISLFHLSLISAFRSRNFPWGPKDAVYLFARKRWIQVVFVVAYTATFTSVTAGVSNILNPFPVFQKAHINGTELDFSPTPESPPDCLKWLNAHANLILPETCQWENYNGLNYNTCRDGEMADILESGRLNVLSGGRSNFEVVSFSGLGVRDGLQFIRPLRGVLPIGPDGVQAFNTLEKSPLDAARASLYNQTNPNSYFQFYSYTLHQQGVASNISCSQDSQSPVAVFPSDSDTVGTVQFNGTCDGQTNVLPNGKTFVSLNSKNSLTFWACKSLPASYLIYLRGRQNYAGTIGNITCTVSMQPTIFKVKYTSDLGAFLTFHPEATSPATFDGFLDQAVVALGSLIADAQTQQVNLVAESVTALGAKYFDLTTDKQQPANYLPLYEAMIQGILEYEVAYTRLLYSTFPDRPPSCDRTVNGSTSYTALGWSVDFSNIYFLIPHTIINLTSFILLLLAMCRAKRGSYKHDPTHPDVLMTFAKLERHPDSAGNHTTIGDRLVFHQEGYTPAPVFLKSLEKSLEIDNISTH